MSIVVPAVNDESNQNENADQFAPFADKMADAGLPQLAIDSFKYYYDQLHSGETGFIDSETAQPVAELPDATQLSAYRGEGEEALSRTVVLRLNGGLGTSMGMTGPKSLLKVKEELSFLDIIVQQVLSMRKQYDIRLPLILMNSFNTSDATEATLATYPELKQSIPFGFLQHKVPKILKESMAPADWPKVPEKEWCPPGHGDLYAALITLSLIHI